jgi:hypothetical protein
VNFARILPFLLAGQHIRREEWPKGLNIHLAVAKLKLYQNYDGLSRKVIIGDDDIKSDDWEIFRLLPI